MSIPPIPPPSPIPAFSGPPTVYVDPAEPIPELGPKSNGEEAGDEDAIPVDSILREIPPWLTSLAAHFLILIVVALMWFSRPTKDPIDFSGRFADRIGEQLDSDLLELSAVEAPEVTDPVLVTQPELAVDDPLAAPPDLPITLDRGILSSTLVQPVVGLAFQGRSIGMKEQLTKSYGGDALTEEAVLLALEWLERNQKRNGSWSLVGPYSDGANIENPAAATAMALLAFQGAGYTHVEGKYQDVVKQGMYFLINQQNRAGSFYRGRERHHRPYTQAMATIAVCEAYAMTRDESLREPAQRAVDYAIEIQDIQGGWRYDPRNESDTSVTGWYLMGLQSARMAGLIVPSPVFDNVAKYLDLAACEGGARYSYMPGGFESPAMTAEGLLCRQYLGWRRDDSRMQQGVAYLMANPMSWSDRNTYYWYYATQVLHNMEGYEWQTWNEQMKKLLVANQEKVGKERGSWPSKGDRWGAYGGRLFVTCLSTYMLEVYYRHLPIYSPLYRDATNK